nr:protein FAR1-RELATED SEQUENCE 5-like [Ipomoea batatas]
MNSASGGCDEGYSTDIGVEGSACDMEISPGMTKYWRPNCVESLKPHVGQQFVSLDSAFGFYKQYAGSVGFDCRQSTTRKGRGGVVVLKQQFTMSVFADRCLPVIFLAWERPLLLAIGAVVAVVDVRHQILELTDFPPQLYHEEENWSSIELVRALHPHLFAIDQCIDDHLTPIQICRAKWCLNHGSAASTSTIFLVNALGVIYAVVFSNNHLHSFNIAGITFAVLFVISIFPFGRPRTAATSSAVIWIVCPFWSCNVQLLGLKFSTNHNPSWRGKLVICRSRRLPNPMSFTTWHYAGLSCFTALVSIFGSALIFRPSSSALVVSSPTSICSGLSTSSAWAGCSSSICSRWGCCACSVGCSSSRSCSGSAVDVQGSLLVDVFPSSIAFRLLPA